MTTTTDRIRELISASGASQNEFAAAVGLDASKLSKSLAGVRRFSSLDLARVAAHSRVTVDWLLTGEEPVLAMAARTAGGSAASAVRVAKGLTALRSDLAFLGYRQPWRPLDRTTRSGRLIDQGAELAEAGRARLAEAGFPGVIDDLPCAIEAAFGVDVAISELGAGFDGLAVSSPDAKLIVVAVSSVPARQRFTLAHELGHVLAEDDQELHVDLDVYDRSKRSEQSEMRANAFAAALLMPEALLREAALPDGLTPDSFAKLACALRVSPSALAHRLASFRLIDSGMRDRLGRMSGTDAARTAGRTDEVARQVLAARAPRTPALLAHDAYAAYLAGDATLRPYAQLLGVDVEQLRADLEGRPDLEAPVS